MDFLDLCKKRYSCRSYKPDAVPKDKIDYIIECARLAPSAVNKQPWRLRIVEGDAMTRIWDTYQREWFRTAPMAIIVSVIKDEAWTRGDGKCHADIDGAIIAEHICLAAADQGLGSCWICNFDTQRCKDLLPTSPSEEIVAIIPIGYPADTPKEKIRKPVSDILI